MPWLSVCVALMILSSLEVCGIQEGTPLHEVCSCHHPADVSGQLLPLLFKAGADVNAGNHAVWACMTFLCITMLNSQRNLKSLNQLYIPIGCIGCIQL